MNFCSEQKNYGQTINDFIMVVYGGFFDDSSWLPSWFFNATSFRSSKGWANQQGAKFSVEKCHTSIFLWDFVVAMLMRLKPNFGCTPPEVEQFAPEKLPNPNRKVDFQLAFFRGDVKFRECKSLGMWIFSKSPDSDKHPRRNAQRLQWLFGV